MYEELAIIAAFTFCYSARIGVVPIGVVPRFGAGHHLITCWIKL